MDHRKWMYNVECVTPEYINGLSEFFKTTEDHQAKIGKARISCPCKECTHFICHYDIEMIRYHLFKHGCTNNYTWWKHHGEARRDCNDVVFESNVNNNDNNCGSSNQNINDMLHDAEHNAELDMEKLQQLFIESEKPLKNKDGINTRRDMVEIGIRDQLASQESIVHVKNVVDEDDYNQFDELPPFSIGIQSVDGVLDDTIYLRSDHQEGNLAKD
nr:ulp1 protease family, C-terminal catalytic domain-containing protein [Tanacetum cinerariifolium]